MPPIWAAQESEAGGQRAGGGARAAQHGLAALHAARDRVQHRERLLPAREGEVASARVRRLRRENASRPITASSTTMMTPPKARIMCSKRAGTFTNGSCSAMITTSAIASTICSATTEPASVALGTSVPTSLSRRCSTATRAISPRRAGSSVLSRKPTKSAGTTCA